MLLISTIAIILLIIGLIQIYQLPKRASEDLQIQIAANPVAEIVPPVSRREKFVALLFRLKKHTEFLALLPIIASSIFLFFNSSLICVIVHTVVAIISILLFRSLIAKRVHRSLEYGIGGGFFPTLDCEIITYSKIPEGQAKFLKIQVIPWEWSSFAYQEMMGFIPGDDRAQQSHTAKLDLGNRLNEPDAKLSIMLDAPAVSVTEELKTQILDFNPQGMQFTWNCFFNQSGQHRGRFHFTYVLGSDKFPLSSYDFEFTVYSIFGLTNRHFKIISIILGAIAAALSAFLAKDFSMLLSIFR